MNEEEQEEESRGLPSPSFQFLVSNFATQALIELGEVANPVTKETAFAPARAKFTIDLLEVVREKTDGNLEAGEKRFLDGALYELRMKYVAKLRGE